MPVTKCRFVNGFRGKASAARKVSFCTQKDILGAQPYAFQRSQIVLYDAVLSSLGADMKRRDFIAGLGGAAASWPFTAHAQQGDRMRRIEVLLPAAADDAEFQARVGAFLQALQQLGWTDRPQCGDRHPVGHGQCRRHSQTRGGIGRARAGRHPSHGAPTLGPLLQATRTVPIVFPVASIRSPPASLRVWRGRAATPPVS